MSSNKEYVSIMQSLPVHAYPRANINDECFSSSSCRVLILNLLYAQVRLSRATTSKCISSASFGPR